MTNQLQQQQQQRRAVDLRIPAIEKALLFASILLNTEFSGNEQINDISGFGDRHRSTRAAVEILSRIIMASVSAVGIYAVISGRAALLMPLYAILLVDFFFALPAFYNRDLDPSFADSMADARSYSTGNNQYARFSLMLFSTITMIIKIYFLCVIWKCYRYLRLIELVSPIRLTEIYPHIHQNGPHQYPVVRVLGSTDSTDLGNCHTMAPPPYESIASNMKPPNYEEAMKSSSVSFPSTADPNQSHQQQQQTAVFTDSTEPHNTSSQVINGTSTRSNTENTLNNTETDTSIPFAQVDAGPAQPQNRETSDAPVIVENSPIITNNNTTTATTITSTSTNSRPKTAAETSIDIPRIESIEIRDTH